MPALFFIELVLVAALVKAAHVGFEASLERFHLQLSCIEDKPQRLDKRRPFRIQLQRLLEPNVSLLQLARLLFEGRVKLLERSLGHLIS